MTTNTTQQATVLTIRVLLARRNKSQRWLSDAAGVTTHWVSRRMTSKTPFSTDDIDIVCTAFGIGHVEFFTAEPIAVAA